MEKWPVPSKSGRFFCPRRTIFADKNGPHFRRKGRLVRPQHDFRLRAPGRRPENRKYGDLRQALDRGPTRSRRASRSEVGDLRALRPKVCAILTIVAIESAPTRRENVQKPRVENSFDSLKSSFDQYDRGMSARPNSRPDAAEARKAPLPILTERNPKIKNFPSAARFF